VHTRVNIGNAGWWVGLTAALLVAPALGQQPWRFATDERVVAFGDVHGAYENLVGLLQAASVIDANLRWSAGAAHVVSLGDLVDRGAATRPVLDLMLRLESEAAAAGGKLHVVLGNHELMTLLGDWRYVARGDYESFAADESDAERAAAYAAFATAAGGDSAAARSTFDSTFPRGYFARQAAFAPTGRYGAWLLERPALVVVNGTVFVHGGLAPAVAQHGLALNERLRATLDRYFALRARLVASGVLPAFDRARDTERAAAAAPGAERDEFLGVAGAEELGSASPLWYRGSVYCKPILEQPLLDAALERLGVTRAVVGHTPTADRRVRSLYGGKLLMLDTGMLADYYYGQPAVLLIDGDGDPAVRYAAAAATAAPEVGQTFAYGRTEAELRAALDNGAVASTQRAGASEPWQVVVQDGDAALAATFYPERGTGDAELAAATLDDLLGTDLVAPTVARTIDGQRGALQLTFPGAVSERERAEQRRAFSGWCALEPQLELMRAFDALILNRGRTAESVHFANDLTDLLLVDHAEAFAPQNLPAGIRDLPLPGELRAALRTLDEPGLTAALGAWLDAAQIRALLARRDRLLELSTPR
jgi:3',5'-cyclic AMP phosphodiesterase CpdA